MSVTAIEKVVRRLRWRLRAQAALRHGLLLGAVGLVAFAVLVVLVKARVIPTDWLWVGGGLAIGLPALGLAIGGLARFADIRLATALDAAGGLHSRLGSALAFARSHERTPMQDLAIADALTVLERARPESAAPWRWGAFALGASALLSASALTGPALFALELPVEATSATTVARVVVPPPFKRAKAEVRKEDEERLAELAKDLADETKAAADPAVKDFLEDLNELIRALQEGRITPEEAHARLAALEKALNEWKDKNAKGAEEVEKKLQAAAEKLKKAHELLEPLLEALKDKAWKEAAAELEKLAEKVEKKELKEADQKKLAKDLDELAKALQNERQKEKERLEKERDRLKEKQQREKDRFAEKDRDRLQETERRLEQLDDPKQQDEMSDPERQLERLADELDDAARDMLRRLSEELEKLAQEAGEKGPEDEQRRQQPGQQGQQGENGENGQEGQEGQDGQMTEEDLKRAAEALRRMAQGNQGRQQMRIAQGRMIDVKEMMRRGGQSGKGQEGEDGQGENGQGKQAGGRQPGEQGEGEGDAYERFEKSAQGGGEDGELMLGESPGDKGDEMLLLGGPKGQGLPIPGKGDGRNKPAIGQDGIGEGHDKNLFGEKTSMEGVETKEVFVPGQHGDGESQKRVVTTAAQKGFATRGYRQVHQDYAGVVEDALEKEHIPPGKRTYVRKYFDLIRPR